MDREDANRLKHELMAPLQAMVSDLDYLESTVEKPEEKELVSKIINQARFFSLLIKNIVFSPAVSGNTKPTDICQSMRRVIELFRRHAQEKQIIFDVLDRDCFPTVNVVPDAITLVFMNLIDNAIKYSFPKTHIVVTISAFSKTLRLDIANIGYGLLPEEIEGGEIYRSGYRGCQIRGDHSLYGKGIGLARVKDIIELHRATISVDSILLGDAVDSTYMTTVSLRFPLEG